MPTYKDMQQISFDEGATIYNLRDSSKASLTSNNDFEGINSFPEVDITTSNNSSTGNDVVNILAVTDDSTSTSLNITSADNLLLNLTLNGTNVATISDIPTVVDTYSSTGTDAVSGKGVKAALDTLSIPTTTNSVTSGSTDALTSGGAYTNLVKRLSTSTATGSTSQGVYIDSTGTVQVCSAVTSNYSSTGTAPVNGTAVASAISNKADSSIITTQSITTLNSGTINLTHNTVIYKHTPSANTTYTFNKTNLTISSSLAYTFELYIVMSTLKTLTFPASLVWQGGTTPDMSKTGTYFFAFRTVDGGTTWLGNLQGVW